MTGFSLAERGEIAFPALGDHVFLRPTFAALCAMEEETGASLVSLARRFAEGQFTLLDCERVVRAGLKGGGCNVPSDLGETLMALGVLNLAPVLTRFLEAALLGQGLASDHAQ